MSNPTFERIQTEIDEAPVIQKGEFDVIID